MENNFKIVDNKKLGLLRGKIQLLKVNYHWDYIREKNNNEISFNKPEDYMKWILEIDKDIEELYASKN